MNRDVEECEKVTNVTLILIPCKLRIPLEQTMGDGIDERYRNLRISFQLKK